MKREKPTPGSDFRGWPLKERELHVLILRGFPSMPGNPSYRTQKTPDTPGGFMVNRTLKRRHGDAGAAGFAASSGISAAPANGGNRP